MDLMQGDGYKEDIGKGYTEAHSVEWEMKFIKRLAEGRKYYKLKRFYPAGYAITDAQEKVTSFVEVKRRHESYKAQHSFILALGKVLRLRQLEIQSGVPVVIWVEWSDAVGGIPVMLPIMKCFIGARDAASRTTGEAEPLVAYDMNLITLHKKGTGE